MIKFIRHKGSASTILHCIHVLENKNKIMAELLILRQIGSLSRRCKLQLLALTLQVTLGIR